MLATLGVLVSAGYAAGSARPLLHRVGTELKTAAPNTETSAARSVGRGHVVPIGGPATATYPGRYTIRGRTAAVGTVYATGAVVLRGRWDDNSWRVLHRTRTDARGAYTVVARLDRRGTLHLRLETPDGYVATKALRVL